MSTEVGKIDNFPAWARKLSFLPTELDIFDIRQHYVRIVFIFQRLILLSFIISYTDKHEFSSIRNWIRCCNDVMNDVDCVIKHDVYPQNVHSCSKNIHGISVYVLKISVVYKKKYIIRDILHGYSRS